MAYSNVWFKNPCAISTWPKKKHFSLIYQAIPLCRHWCTLLSVFESEVTGLRQCGSLTHWPWGISVVDVLQHGVMVRGHVCKKSSVWLRSPSHVEESVEDTGLLAVFPQYGKVFPSSETLLLLPFSWFTCHGFIWTLILFNIFKTTLRIISVTPFFGGGGVSCPRTASGSQSTNWVFSWNPDLCLWVSVRPGWVQWCPFLLDPGPSQGSSPCSATCGSPCWSQEWEERSPRPLLRVQWIRGGLLFASAWHPLYRESRGARWSVCWLFLLSSSYDGLCLSEGPSATVRVLSSSLS